MIDEGDLSGLVNGNHAVANRTQSRGQMLFAASQARFAFAQPIFGIVLVKCHFDGGHEFAFFKRLEQKSIRQRGFGTRQSVIVGIGGEKNYRHSELFAQRQRGFDAIALAFDIDVLQHQMRLHRRRFFQCAVERCPLKLAPRSPGDAVWPRISRATMRSSSTIKMRCRSARCQFLRHPDQNDSSKVCCKYLQWGVVAKTS